jgi:cytochrome c oxidase assembly protein subunit 15
MTTQPLVDLSPLWQVMLAGLSLAAAALAWMWLRQRDVITSGWIRPLTLLTLFLTFDLVLFGAFTRLTDSGLGCPDWPGCYGNASPLGAHAAIAAAQSALPSGPVTHGKAWVEMVHRYLATGVGVLILVLTAASWRKRVKGGSTEAVADVGWPMATLLWVCIQGAFGALTVTMKLFPAIVTLHLLGGLMLLALLGIQAERLVRFQSGRPRVLVTLATRGLMLTAVVLLGVQVALGGWVSTNYAVLACSDFPMCQNSWWPEMNFDQGFQIWRELGLTPSGEYITFAALTAIHFVHRCTAVAVLAALGLLAWRLAPVAELRIQSRLILALVVMQVATGMANAVLGWPLAAALMHTGGAAALVLVLTWTVAGSRSSRAAVHLPRPTAMDFSA